MRKFRRRVRAKIESLRWSLALSFAGKVAAGRKVEGWVWWAGRDDEFFNYGGPNINREDAILDGRCSDDGEGFYIIEAKCGDYTLNAESILTDMLDNAELVYEDYSEWSCPKEKRGSATAELQTLLDAWLTRHDSLFTPATSFVQQRNLEFIPGEPEDE